MGGGEAGPRVQVCSFGIRTLDTFHFLLLISFLGQQTVQSLPLYCFRGLSLYSSLDSLKSEIVDLKHSVAESLISPAKKSIEELQQDLSKRINLEELKINLDSLNLDKLQLPSPQLVSAEEQKAGR